jgi:tetratricopeptide (TPR) repeat protein
MGTLGELPIGERVADRFRVDGVLGIGGMGVVYRAHDERLGVDVALKVLRSDFAQREGAFERFRQELLLARQISSPHVVRIHDLVLHDSRWLISMDLIDGGSLASLLEQHGTLPLEQALTIARQIALGLAAAHACGVIHRDLKPANVLLDREQRAFVSDFGVARATGVTGLTASGLIVGTPEYLSPEQARGESIDGRSDLFALGLMLFEMLTGRPAYEAGTPAEMLAQRMLRPAPPLRSVRPELPRWVEQLVIRLVALRPSQRLPTAEATVDAIDRRRVAAAPIDRARAIGWAAIGALAIGAVALSPAIERSVLPWLTEFTRAPARSAWLALPMSVSGGSADIARALDSLLGSAWLEAGVDVVDPGRVQRALALLGFDPESASRFPERLDGVVPHEQLLRPTLVIDDARVILDLAVLEPGAAAPLVSARTPALTIDSLPAALGRLAAEVGLPVDALTPAGWPTSLDVLARYGAALDAGPADSETLLAEVLAAEPQFAAAWLARLERAGRRAAAATRDQLAEAALEALRGVRGRDAERARALAQLTLGNADAAIAALAPMVQKTPMDLPLRVQHAEALEAAGRLAEAAVELDAVLAVDATNPAAKLDRGRIALQSGDAQLAIDRYLGNALQLFTRLADDSGRGDTLHALGVGYERLGRGAASREHFEQAARLRLASGDPGGAASSLRNLGYGLGIEGRFDEAWEVFARARALLEPLADAAALADLANDEGLIAEEAGDFVRAGERYREALAQRRAQGDAIGAGNAALNLGFLYLHGGETASARVHLLEAEAAFERGGDEVGMVRAGQKLALLDFNDGLLSAARGRLDAALAVSVRLQLIEEQAVSLAGLADLDRHAGQFGAALERLATAQGLFEQRGDARGQVEVLLGRAEIAALLEHWDEVESLLAPLASERPASAEQAAVVDLLLAEAAVAQDDTVTARERIAAALGAADDVGSHSLRVRAQLSHARWTAASGDDAGARAALAAADQLLARQSSTSLRLDREWTALHLATAASVQDDYIRALDAAKAAAPWSGSARLHRRAAERLSAAGLEQAAADAQAASTAAFEQLRASLTPETDAQRS